jgi:hypothetical protein
MRSLRPTSILLGVLVDKVTFVAGAIALAGVLGVAAPGFLSLALALGLATITLGGYVAGRHARSNPLGHGFAVGVVAVAISSGRFLVNTLWPPAEAAARHPIGWELLGWSGALAAGVLGGWLAKFVAERSSGQAQPRPGEARWGLWLPVFFAVIALFAFLEQL